MDEGKKREKIIAAEQFNIFGNEPNKMAGENFSSNIFFRDCDLTTKSPFKHYIPPKKKKKLLLFHVALMKSLTEDERDELEKMKYDLRKVDFQIERQYLMWWHKAKKFSGVPCMTYLVDVIKTLLQSKKQNKKRLQILLFVMMQRRLDQ